MMIYTKSVSPSTRFKLEQFLMFLSYICILGFLNFHLFHISSYSFSLPNAMSHFMVESFVLTHRDKY